MPEYLEVRSGAGATVVALADTDLVIGRDPANQIALVSDPEVSRKHALIQRLPVGWAISDLSSRNGTRVNGERVHGQRALNDGDEVSVGTSRMIFHSGAPAGEPTRTAEPPPVLTRREQDVLLALFQPARTAAPGMFTEPASTKEIAAALFVTEAAVKQHLAHLYDKFGILDGDRRRVHLANEALRRGAIRLSDLTKPAG
jgi:hypothetical protein